MVAYQLSDIEGAINVSVNTVATNAEIMNPAPTYTAIRRRLKPCGINHQ
jgi:hypothetical protein